MASASKNKGKRFERQVADYLSNLFGMNFKRSITSGAFTGGKNQSRIQSMDSGQVKLVRGDIIPPDELDLVIECKNHKEFGTGFSGLVAGNNLKLEGWMNEVLFDSEINQVPNFLVFKITDNTGRMFFVLPTEIFSPEIFKTYTYTIYENYSASEITKDENPVQYLIVDDWTFSENKDKVLEAIKSYKR